MREKNREGRTREIEKVWQKIDKERQIKKRETEKNEREKKRGEIERDWEREIKRWIEKLKDR